MHRETIVEEFTHQADTFNQSSVANAPGLLDAILRMAQPRPEQRWLDVACGPGVLARALAPMVAEVHGVDATPAMVALARREAHAQALTNLTVSLGDAGALAFAPGSWDGAVSRFALHHIPVPERVMGEMARVVAPGGCVIVADSLADESAEAYAWSQEIERLRDPSHWASLSAPRMRALGQAAGLALEQEAEVTLGIDFEDWLARGSGHVNAALVERALASRPGGGECFAVSSGPRGRVLHYRVLLTRWRR
jgi:ubiquinone/menaquinone biosynthesis C-methylase UbiE